MARAQGRPQSRRLRKTSLQSHTRLPQRELARAVYVHLPKEIYRLEEINLPSNLAGLPPREFGGVALGVLSAIRRK